MGLKPGPKPIAKSTGKPDQRRRDNKDMILTRHFRTAFVS